MTDIQLLDNQTIDKIAAGEVVERPVNVVKELVENAIDGEATIVNVEIKNGGEELIRVTDNGVGIKSNQVKTAFLRHATSKLTNISDLETLHSLGFRGEALSSISAVSKTEMITKPHDQLLGSHIAIDGGKLNMLEEIGAPNGTTVIVRQLFYNTPARKKFLKSATVEAGRIIDLCEKIALSHPEISFTLIVNSKTKFSTSGNGDLKDAIYRIRGKDIFNRLLKLDYEKEGIKISGYIARPELNFGTRESEVFFVNERLVEARELSISLEEGFKGRLMQHRFPYGILFIDLDPGEIDVNVHPRKAEIKFSDAITVTNIVTEAVYTALKEPELIPIVEVKAPEPVEYKPVEAPKETPGPLYRPTETVPQKVEPFEIERIRENVLSRSEEIKEEPIYEQENLFEERLISDAPLKEYKIIGQVFDTYWLITLSDNLYIVDQHAAHEKVNYEALLKAYKSEENKPVQYINPPEIVNLSRGEDTVLKNNFDVFTRIGYEIESFGEASYAIRGVPLELYGNTATGMFERLIRELYEHEKLTNPDVVLEKLASMSCKAAIKGGMRVSALEMNELMKKLMSLDDPYHCPHGRPVFIQITREELEKKFKRIV